MWLLVACTAGTSETGKVTDDSGTTGEETPGIVAVVFMHSEDPNHPDTPDFLDPTSADSWVAARRALVAFANQLDAAGVPWDFQPDWNFSRAVLAWEVEGGAPDGYSAADVQEMMQETGDKNIYRWLSEDRGVQIDPHSHEGYAFGDSVAYNYADVAQLIDEIGVSPSGIVGGHVISEDSYQDWPRFKTPLKAAHDESYSWTATALIGGGTANHSGELEGSGIWFPTEPGSPPDYDNYYRNDASSDLPAVGNWPGDALDPLLAQLGPIRTATVAINQSDLVMAACGTLDNEDQIADLGSCDFETAAADSIAANIAPLMTHPVVGFRTFNGLLDIWKTDFGGEAALCTGYGDDCTAAF